MVYFCIVMVLLLLVLIICVSDVVRLCMLLVSGLVGLFGKILNRLWLMMFLWCISVVWV